MADSTFTFRVDEELKVAFSAVADDDERTAAQLLRLLMRQAVEHRRGAQDHDRWFIDQVHQALAEADDPGVERIGHADVATSWQRQRADFERRGAGRTA